jgi:transcriptional regulator with XRE-family HTH domain
MVRPPLSPEDRARGERLGLLLRQARGPRSMAEIAAASGVPVETLRKIETGRIATPAFFTVAALASVLGLALEEIAGHCAGGHPAGGHGAGGPRSGVGPDPAAALTA